MTVVQKSPEIPEEILVVPVEPAAKRAKQAKELTDKQKAASLKNCACDVKVLSIVTQSAKTTYVTRSK